ncbi:MAG: hypothetical protein IKH90_08580 [Ruminococcus sp.]|nr:hypothetical protein [Ruminococcus sp.]
MNSKYDMQSLMERNKESFREASETAPMVVVQEQNWTAVLKILSSICQSQDEVREEIKELPTGKQMTRYEQNQSILLGRYQQESEQNRQQIHQEMKEMSSDLLKQVGSMSAEYSSKLKEQENWRQKLSSKLFKILIASQALQLILWAILLRWLR